MKTDNLFFEEGKEALLRGISKTTKAIEGTYGAAGGNMFIQEKLRPFHSVRNDGKAIVDAIKLADPIENMGASIMKEAGDKADKESGDGRKTTMLLTKAILEEASKVKDVAPLEIKRSLDAALTKVLDAIDAQKKEIPLEEIGKVASIAAENEEIGKLIQEIYVQIGREGIIEHEPSHLPSAFYEITEGVKLRNAGAFGRFSFNAPANAPTEAIFKNPKILICKDKIVSVDQLEPIFEQASANSINELVIYCEDIDMSVASRLALTHLQGGFKTLIIKSPNIWREWIYEDFAAMTGATPIDSKEGATFKGFKIDWLGTCDKIVSNADETRVIGIKDLSEHIKHLESLATEDNQFLVRTSWLKTKVAILKVGANSESELSYLIKKAKDACSASYWALREGIIAGGGTPLFLIANAVLAHDSDIGSRILSLALQRPHQQILANMGETAPMLDFGEHVVDAAIITKNCVKNAVSIAGTILTAKGVIIIPEEPPKIDVPQMPIMR